MEKMQEYSAIYLFSCLLVAVIVFVCVVSLRVPSVRAEVRKFEDAMYQRANELTKQISAEGTARLVANSQLSKEHTALAWRVNTLEHAPAITPASSGNVTVLAWCATVLPPNGTFEATCQR